MRKQFYNCLVISLLIFVGVGCKSQTEQTKIAGQKDANEQTVKQEDANGCRLPYRMEKAEVTNEDLNSALYGKMSDEQTEYKKWLLQQNKNRNWPLSLMPLTA